MDSYHQLSIGSALQSPGLFRSIKFDWFFIILLGTWTLFAVQATGSLLASQTTGRSPRDDSPVYNLNFKRQYNSLFNIMCFKSKKFRKKDKMSASLCVCVSVGVSRCMCLHVTMFASQTREHLENLKKTFKIRWMKDERVTFANWVAFANWTWLSN